MHNTVREYEIVIVDDGSTDRSNEIIRELQKELPRIVLLTNDTNRNIAYSARRAFKAARDSRLPALVSRRPVQLAG